MFIDGTANERHRVGERRPVGGAIDALRTPSRDRRRHPSAANRRCAPRRATVGRQPRRRRLPIEIVVREDRAVARLPDLERQRRAAAAHRNVGRRRLDRHPLAAIHRPLLADVDALERRSCTSAPVAVMPHAMRALWPSAMNGTPGIVTPITSRPAATRCISYQTDGNSICRCGSLARIGRPPSCVRRPAPSCCCCRAARRPPATRDRAGVACSRRLSAAGAASLRGA